MTENKLATLISTIFFGATLRGFGACLAPRSARRLVERLDLTGLKAGAKVQWTKAVEPDQARIPMVRIAHGDAVVSLMEGWGDWNDGEGTTLAMDLGVPVPEGMVALLPWPHKA